MASECPLDDVPEILEPIERLCRLICFAETPADFFARLDNEPWFSGTDRDTTLEQILKQRRPTDGLTPLLIAITEDREIELLQWLVDHGSDIHVLTEDRIFAVGNFGVLPIVAGRNLLHIAYRCGASSAVKAWLVAHYPEMEEAVDANGLKPSALSPSTVDDPRQSQRRMLRSSDVSAFEDFVGQSVAEFFAIPSQLDVLAPGLCAFQMLTAEKCDLLERFLASHPPTEVTRPNTMNHYGLNLETSAFAPVLNHLMIDWLPALLRKHCQDSQAPYLSGALTVPDIAKSYLKAPPLNPDFEFTSQYSFTIEYLGLDGQSVVSEESGRDRLAFHYDKSYFTVNMCLSLPNELEGSTLYFDYSNKHSPFDFSSTDDLFPVAHRRGWAVAHAGSLYHGASPIVKEKRKNLVIWGR